MLHSRCLPGHQRGPCVEVKPAVLSSGNRRHVSGRVCVWPELSDLLLLPSFNAVDALAAAVSHMPLAYEPVASPCSLMKCGDVVHRSTLDLVLRGEDGGLDLRVLPLLALAVSYLFVTPGNAPAGNTGSREGPDLKTLVHSLTPCAPPYLPPLVPVRASSPSSCCAVAVLLLSCCLPALLPHTPTQASSRAHLTTTLPRPCGGAQGKYIARSVRPSCLPACLPGRPAGPHSPLVHSPARCPRQTRPCI